MSSELTNLLPQSNIKAFKREYLIRLATVAVILVIGIVLVQAVLLLPAYLYERQAADGNTAELKRLSSTLATTQEQEVQTEQAALQAESTHLQSLAQIPTASGAISAVLAVARPGIVITGFAFTPQVAGTPGNMEVTGTADTREDLRSYDGALGALPFISNADLPISDYAKDTDIPFIITLTGSFVITTPSP